MVQSYQNNPHILVYTLIVTILLSCLLIMLNFILNGTLKRKNSLDFKKYNKRKETYEFGVNSLGTANTTNTLQSLILALLFLLFDIEVTLLVPMILAIQSSNSYKQVLIIIYLIFIMLSVYIEITSNVISFYKNKKI